MVSILVLFSIGCEIPSIRIGKRKTGSTPAERYAAAYWAFRDGHEIVKRNLGKNTLAVQTGMQEIIDSLRSMSLLVTEPYASGIKGYIPEYERLRTSFEQGVYTGGTLDTLDRYESEFIRRFSPGAVILRGPEDRVSSRPPPTRLEDPSFDPVSEVPYWVLYKAWEKLHTDLVKAYTEGEAGVEKIYGRLESVLCLLKERLKAQDRQLLQIYINEYKRIYNSTEGFKVLHEGVTKQDILRELGAVGSATAQAFGRER